MDKYTKKDIESSLYYIICIKSTIEDLEATIERLEEEIDDKNNEIDELKKQLN